MSPRRRTSSFEDIMEAMSLLPWWVGVFGSVVVFGIGKRLAAGKPPELVSLYVVGFGILATGMLIGGVVSPFRRANRKRLVDRQQNLDTLHDLSWREFERMIGEVYRQKGYHVEESGGGGADGGVDLVLRGPEGKVLVQCKRWKNRKVGVDKVRELYGVVQAEGAAEGVLAATSEFTLDARAFARGKPLTLLDGRQVERMVREVQTDGKAATSETRSPPLHPSPLCPVCGTPLVLRTARRGANKGGQFYGCPNFPKCRGTRDL